MYDVKKLSNLSADFPHFRTAALHLQAHESTFDLLIACSYSRFLLIFFAFCVRTNERSLCANEQSGQ